MIVGLSKQCRRIVCGIWLRVQRYWALPLTLPAALLMRLSAPVVLLRLHGLRSDRIGHFLNEADLYLSHRISEGQPPRTIDRFFFTGIPTNHTALELIDRRLPVSSIWDHIDRASRLMPNWEKHVTPWLRGCDQWGYFDRCPSHFQLMAEENEAGEAFLKSIGAEGRPIVCLYNRDGSYLKAAQERIDFSYHDYRDSSIQNYMPSARELARVGCTVLRMGAVVQELIEEEEHIIDYANRFRDDLLDIYISSRCIFSLGTTTGLSDMARVFRKPTASANACPFLTTKLYSAGWRELFIPKLYRWEKSGRIVTLAEMLENGSCNFGLTEQFRAAGIVLEENSPEDILELMREMRERVQGTWTDQPDDEERQKKFWHATGCAGSLTPRIGTAFLKKYADALFT